MRGGTFMHTITIDGPAGSGKSSAARCLAENLDGFYYLNTGAVYRTLAYALDEAGFGPGDMRSSRGACLEICSSCRIGIRYVPTGNGLYRQDMTLGGTCIPETYLRAPGMGELASACSEDPSVRAIANDAIRKAVKGLDIIADGRDCGTAMFPQAMLKFYLWADRSERARRRMFQERDEKDHSVETLTAIARDLAKRDKRDASRLDAPLAYPAGAVWIDTTGLKEQQVHKLLLDMARAMLGNAAII